MRRLETIAAQLVNGPLVEYRLEGGDVAVLTMHRPPVNALNKALFGLLLEGLQRAQSDPQVKGIVISGWNGGPFAAGADIKAMGKNAPVGHLSDATFVALETSKKRVVAAINRFALGGGLELAMLCHDRVTHSEAKLGLPECTLGLIPGWGGTQRLPRLVGIPQACSMILIGRAMSGADALGAGLVDVLVDDEAAVLAAAVLRARLPGHGTPVLDRTLPGDLTMAEAALKEAERRADRGGRMVHGRAAVIALRAGQQGPRDAGLAEERRQLERCMVHPAHAALRHGFLARRQAGKGVGAVVGAQWERVVVVGGGKMGLGIAVCCQRAGMTVAVVEVNDAARIKAEKVLQPLGVTVLASMEGSALHDAQLVIEAVPEILSLKRRVLSSAAAAAPNAVMATNTSSIELCHIGAGLSFADRIIGLHYFNPPVKMQLLEVVVTSELDPAIIAAAVAFSRRQQKTPVVVRSGPGFAANRIFFPYSRAARLFCSAATGGLSPYLLDRALQVFGFPLGPFALADLVGLDVSLAVGAVAASAFPRLAELAAGEEHAEDVTAALVGLGRLGRTTGAGWYHYAPDSRKPMKDAWVEERFFANQQATIDYADAAEAMVCLVANEGARLMEEKAVQRESDIDVCTVVGFGFPPELGGIMFWARNVRSWPAIVQTLDRWKAHYNGLALFDACDWARQQ